MAARFLGIFWHQSLELVLQRSCSRKAGRVVRVQARELRPRVRCTLSTTRTASIRGRGGSTRNRRGDSPLSTQRQNLRSAVITGAGRDCRQGSSAPTCHPSVMIDSTGLAGIGDPHVVLQLRHVLCGRAFLPRTTGSMNFASNTAPLPSTIPSRVAPSSGSPDAAPASGSERPRGRNCARISARSRDLSIDRAKRADAHASWGYRR
jgi:hypothetical protein